MKIMNLTPHSITITNESGIPLFTVEPSGVIARVSARTIVMGSVDVGEIQIPITGTTYGEIEGLPDPKNGIIYVVSSLVAQRCSNRQDIFIPNESVRDENGRIVGCRSLGRV
jgi:hypothetical protein